MADLTFAEVSAVLKYDAATGALRWKERTPAMFVGSGVRSAEHECNRWNSRYAGKDALRYVDKKWGYLMGAIYGRNYPAHRIAWLLHYGAWPNHQIDHIDGKPMNNAIGNLRDVPNAVNGKNQKKHSTNTSGHTGVSWNNRDKLWYARIHIDGRIKHIIATSDKQIAIEARAAAAKESGYSDRHGL